RALLATPPRTPDARLDRVVIPCPLGPSLVTGLAFGILPPLQGPSGGLGDSLAEGSRGASGRRGKRIRSALVVAEFALALVLLVGAVLLVRTLWRLQQVDVGFRPSGVTTASLWLPQPDIRENGRYNDLAPQTAFYRRALEKIAALPGVESAAGATRVPFNSAIFPSRLEIEGRDSERDGVAVAVSSSASIGYFRTLEIPLKAGR